MYLKRIRIYGFKSFAQDVTVELQPGITALVGPNGGGKSNVVDAIRWALGEQRLRDLRAERWEDLLHQGGPGRAAARLAEVTLEFDNQDGEMPQWPESLTVARRYYRSGDSEYLINGQAVRLKDVTDLFLDSGLGRFSYAIISQGRVEGALLQKPLDRLEQLQEAAGVSRYKVRKKETLSHLAETEAKLTRLTDLLDEVSRQIEEVRERAEVESRYRTWESLRQDWQRRLDYTEYRRAMEKKGRLTQQLAQLEEERRQLAAELTRVLEEQARVREVVAAGAGAAESELTELEALNAQDTQLRLKDTELGSRLIHMQREEETLQQSIDMLEVQRAELTREQPQAGGDVLDLTALKEEERELAEALNAATRDRELKEASIQELTLQLSAWRSERHQLEQRVARLKGVLRIGEGQSEVMDVLANRQAEARKLEQEVRLLTEEVVHLTEERTRLKAFTATVEQEAYSLRHQLAGRQARLRALHQLEAEGEGLNAGVRAVLKGQQNGQISGVIGTLGSLVDSEGDLILAIQTAMGGSHQDVVIENEERARHAVRYLKTGSLGRATFLPLDTVRAARVNPEDYRRLTREAGVVGWAADLVKSDPAIRPAVNHVLGRVLIVQSLEDATRLGGVHNFRYKMVTLDGQVVHAGGAITGGSRVVERNSRTARKVELEELNRRIEEDRKTVAGKEELLLSTRQELEDVDQKLDAAREILSDRRNRFLQVRRELALDDNIGDPAALMESMERLDREVAQKEAQLSERHADFATHELEYQDRLRKTEALKARIREREQGLREQQLIFERIQQELARLTQQQDAHRRRLSALEAETAGVTAERAQLAQEMAAVASTLKQREGERAERLKALTRAREQLLQLENRQRVLELDDRKMEQKGHSWNQEVLEITVRFEQYAIPDTLEPLSRAEEDNARREILRITHSLSELGAVVPGSLALYEQLQERQSFLERESQDVEDARRELIATLREIDQEMERRVQETAKRVEQAFQEACRQLYGGGDGGFTWLDGEDSGVELWVRPPGKRPSHLGLLSGGEKALGGIAWLFSLLEVRPSPFVVLDEVEASLDEANAARFARYVQMARGNTQYVIVTHHRQTMEVADALWGVAGDGQGQSRLISVLLQDAEALTS